MGGSWSAELNNDEEPVEKVFSINKIFWDTDGNLRHGKSVRNRDDEVIALLEKDVTVEEPEKELWIIVPSRWLRIWLVFAHMKLGQEPGKIDTKTLLVQDAEFPGGWRPLQTLKPPNFEKNMNPSAPDTPGHYRRISLPAFKKLVDLYGIIGPVIAVRGFPYDDLFRWRVFSTIDTIDESSMPEPVIIAKTAELSTKPSDKLMNSLAGGLSSLKSLF